MRSMLEPVTQAHGITRTATWQQLGKAYNTFDYSLSSTPTALRALLTCVVGTHLQQCCIHTSADPGHNTRQCSSASCMSDP